MTELSERLFFEKQFASQRIRKGAKDYTEYEDGKRALTAANLPPDTYSRAIGYLADWVGV